MNYFHEYALLVVVAIPMLAIIGLNVYLWWGGERGTLLMPSFTSLPAVIEAREEVQEAMPIGYESALAPQPAMIDVVPANDVHVREAA